MLFTRERQGACLERRNSTVQLTLPGKRACFQWWQRRWMAFGFPIQCTFCPGKTDCKGAGRPAGNRICHRKLLYCQIPGKQSSCYYRGSHSGTGYRESQLYLYVPAESPERSESFCRLEKNTCLYITGKGKGYQKLKAMVSELHLEGRVILTGWLEKPFAFMNLCDYFICPEEEEESWVPLLQKP